jgi:hypothetical protein
LSCAATLALALLTGSCGNGRGIVVVSVDSATPLAGIVQLAVRSTCAGRSSTQTVVPGAPFDLPPPRTFGIEVPSDLAGDFHVELDAVGAGGTLLATAGGSAPLSAGGRADITLVFGGGGGDGGGADLAGTCTPGVGLACATADTLTRCAADGASTETIPCARGCADMPTPHCQLVVPTGLAPASDFNTPGIGDVTLADTVMHSDTGQIDGGKRAANGDPNTMTVDGGIGFHLVTQGADTVGVFVMRGLTITGKITITGLYPVVILANGNVSITKIDAAANCATRTPGPGGYPGGTPASPTGKGPGGGGAGAAGVHTGAGGGGHAEKGGNGANQGSNIGGAGGALYDGPTLVALHGGSGGGALAGGNFVGGAGGGAVQIVSQTQIAITGGIAAGGCGGPGGGGLQGGGDCAGGGAGGAILLEAPTVSVGDNGYLVCGGGGGGGDGNNGIGNGEAAANSNNEIATGRGGFCSARCGGQGGYSGQLGGGNGTTDGTLFGGCGGGAAGYIRINTNPGGATLSSVMSLYVPSSGQINSAGQPAFSQGPIVIR